MKLSIIIPIYKKPKSLERLMASCQQFTSRKLTELILVIDDYSDPQELRDRYPNTKVTTCGYRTGAAMAIWKGFLISSGEYVGFLGDDSELMTPNTDWEIVSALSGSHNLIVGLNDGIQGGRAHPFMSWRFWKDGGGYPPCYRHYYGDTEIFQLARYHEDWIHLEHVELKHHHEYAQKKGYDVEIIEQTKSDSKSLAKYDGETFKRRIEWWESNRKPRTIPWSM